jgi:hypothetical protein
MTRNTRQYKFDVGSEHRLLTYRHTMRQNKRHPCSHLLSVTSKCVWHRVTIHMFNPQFHGLYIRSSTDVKGWVDMQQEVYGDLQGHVWNVEGPQQKLVFYSKLVIWQNSGWGLQTFCWPLAYVILKNPSPFPLVRHQGCELEEFITKVSVAITKKGPGLWT